MEELSAWLNEPAAYQRTRSVHHLRAAYFEWAEAEMAREQLRRHKAFHQDQISQWQALRASIVKRTNPTLSARLARFPESKHERIIAFKLFAYDGLIDQSKLEIRWAEHGLALLDTLDDVKPD